MSIGQGELLSTPIQMANLGATIANRGFYFTPHIIKKIDGDSIPPRFQKKKYTSIDPKHFTTIIEGMELTLTHQDHRATLSSVEGINICGKTGTAQNPHGEDHSIFIAFAPKENPKIAIAVYVENGGWGSTWLCNSMLTLMIEKYLKNKITNKDLEFKMINSKL